MSIISSEIPARRPGDPVYRVVLADETFDMVLTDEQRAAANVKLIARHRRRMLDHLEARMPAVYDMLLAHVLGADILQPEQPEQPEPVKEPEKPEPAEPVVVQALAAAAPTGGLRMSLPTDRERHQAAFRAGADLAGFELPPVGTFSIDLNMSHGAWLTLHLEPGDRANIEAWAKMLGGPVQTRPFEPGRLEIYVQAVYQDVPVRVWTVVPDPGDEDLAAEIDAAELEAELEAVEEYELGEINHADAPYDAGMDPAHEHGIGDGMDEAHEMHGPAE